MDNLRLYPATGEKPTIGKVWQATNKDQDDENAINNNKRQI
jgi:hypothetical protein